jgi:hypothetical protein
MKRKNIDNSTVGRKKQHTPLKEVESLHDQTDPYRLATVKFPIDALSPDWSIGTNRPIDEGHKRRLLQIFKETGVLRQDVRHRLHVACTKAQVQQMLDHLGRSGSQAEGTHGANEGAHPVGAEVPSFEEWESVIGEKAELMAGNHRVEAFKEYLQYSKSSQAERWWVCNVYDRGISLSTRSPRQANRNDRCAATTPPYQASSESRRDHLTRQPWPDMDRARHFVL